MSILSYGLCVGVGVHSKLVQAAVTGTIAWEAYILLFLMSEGWHCICFLLYEMICCYDAFSAGTKDSFHATMKMRPALMLFYTYNLMARFTL